MKKFENNGLVDTRKPPKKRAREIAEIWGEGYEPLINVLELCIKNDIGTLACCAGHKVEDGFSFPYILFKADSPLAYYIFNHMSENCNTVDIISIGRNEIIKAPVFSIHAVASAKEECFNKIGDCIKEYLKEHERNPKVKIKGIKKLDKIYKRNYSNESLVKKILFLCNSKFCTIKNIIYYPKTKEYFFNEFDSDKTWYTEEELAKFYPEGFLMDKEQRKNMSVIGKIKQKCQNSKVGLNRLGELRRMFQKNEKEMQMAERYVSVEKVDEENAEEKNSIDELSFEEKEKYIEELREIFSKESNEEER